MAERSRGEAGHDNSGRGSVSLREVEDILIEERHLRVRMSIVEVDGGLQRPARHRHADAGRKIGSTSNLKS